MCSNRLMPIGLFLIASTVSAPDALAQWYNKNEVNPVDDVKTGLAGVRSNERVEYNHPFLIYECTSEGEQRVQLSTREIHYRDYLTIRVDGGEAIEYSAPRWGDYDQAPTVVLDVKGWGGNRIDENKFNSLVDTLKSAQRTIAVKSDRMTVTFSVSGSTSKINNAQNHCGF